MMRRVWYYFRNLDVRYKLQIKTFLRSNASVMAGKVFIPRRSVDLRTFEKHRPSFAGEWEERNESYDIGWNYRWFLLFRPESGVEFRIVPLFPVWKVDQFGQSGKKNFRSEKLSRIRKLNAFKRSHLGKHPLSGQATSGNPFTKFQTFLHY